MYNKTIQRDLMNPVDARITKLVTGGRPTKDPKGRLIAVRLSARQVHALTQRTRQDGIGLSEAVRRCVDDWASATASPSSLPQPEHRAVARRVRSRDRDIAKLSTGVDQAQTSGGG